MSIPKNQIRSQGTIAQHEHCDDADAKRVKVVLKDGTSVDSSNPLPVDAVVNLDNIEFPTSQTPEVVNINIPTANIEQSFALPTNTRSIMFRLRGNNSNLQFTFQSGQSGTAFFTLTRGAVYKESNLNTAANTTLYFQTTTDGQILELIYWT